MRAERTNEANKKREKKICGNWWIEKLWVDVTEKFLVHGTEKFPNSNVPFEQLIAPDIFQQLTRFIFFMLKVAWHVF